jgi:hypothetical protein
LNKIKNEGARLFKYIECRLEDRFIASAQSKLISLPYLRNRMNQSLMHYAAMAGTEQIARFLKLHKVYGDFKDVGLL